MAWWNAASGEIYRLRNGQGGRPRCPVGKLLAASPELVVVHGRAVLRVDDSAVPASLRFRMQIGGHRQARCTMRRSREFMGANA